VGGSGGPAAATEAADFSSLAVYIAEQITVISVIFVFFLKKPEKKL
jgi:hypothetical protein